MRAARPFPFVIALLSASVLGCPGEPSPRAPTASAGSSASALAGAKPAAVASAAPVAKPAYDALARDAFNRAALRLDAPVYWAADADGDRTVDPDEVVTLLFYPTTSTAKWVDHGAFTASFDALYAELQVADHEPLQGVVASPDELARRRLVLEDLDQGGVTLVRTDLRKASEADRVFVQRMLEVADAIDALYAHEAGVDVLAPQVPKDDLASQSLFRRNWGPQCLGPKTESDPKCSAIPGSPRPKCSAYPASMQDGSTKFCETIEKNPDAKRLVEPFVVVRAKGDKLVPVSLVEAYPELMKRASTALQAAADAVKDPAEAALRAYLQAASKSFSTNDWLPADEAWAKMNAQNSRWYVRVAPDETYWEPCNHKAGFHVTFARINGDSVAWQDKLAPIRQQMEQSLATLIGAPYKARKVDFHLPDFIDIVINAGDDRDAFGATIGQSLPNWGPVAEGRGRTVAMSNLYTDPDSLRIRGELAASLLSKESLAVLVDAPAPGLLSTILHEATHNLGPAHEYAVNGKTDELIFGGGLAATFEELKAQSGALWYLESLRKSALVTPELARQTYVDSIVWAFGHVSRGMYTESGQRKPYSQLAAIQLGMLMAEGAITFDAKSKAANGKDDGAFTLHFDKLPAAIEAMMKTVGRIKATGDKAGAEALARKYVDGAAVPQQTITERMLRQPKASFVYAIDR